MVVRHSDNLQSDPPDNSGSPLVPPLITETEGTLAIQQKWALELVYQHDRMIQQEGLGCYRYRLRQGPGTLP